MVYRVYVEKKEHVANEALSLASDIRSFLGINNLENIRILNRYDVENIDSELFKRCIYTVFAEPQLDNVYDDIDCGNAYVFAVEYLPGQFDARADSAAQCIQLISKGERPTVSNARVYMLYGDLTDEQIAMIKKHLINPVESREAEMSLPATLKVAYDIPTSVETLDGFISFDDSKLASFIAEKGLAMDLDDIRFCRDYFLSEKRDPTITEIKMIDTYWSDHCRHTTFLTTIDSVTFGDELTKNAYKLYEDTRASLGRTKPINLMDIATLAVKHLRKEGLLDKLDESEEINACTVKIKVNVDGEDQDWLLLFKNETHNHPTEIEPFGGAATCIGGAIRDPLSGRAYVYGAMRVTGAADPLKPLSETLRGKLPQRKIVTTAAAGYSSYGNQIGLATGQVDELYHDGYAAKRMEIGAVIAAAPSQNVRRERPAPGDIVILLGGRTGRDGCGGATGSSKSHNLSSLQTCGAEVQKGNAPIERKLQRLFRNPEASRLIKRCNDFGAGGVSVAIGELADGLIIDLDTVPKKYDGLDGTELAISESQERMAVVIDPSDLNAFLALAKDENLEATHVATVTEEPRLVMTWNGKVIVDLSREFLNSNGAEKHIDIATSAPNAFDKIIPENFEEGMRSLLADLNVCSKRGLSERFDSTIGAGTVIMPFGGKNQLTPSQAMVNKISVENGRTNDCSLMSWGFNPYISEKSPYHGAYLAVVESVSKLIASGASFDDIYLTFQEYFEKPLKDARRWGKPLSALLGAFKAQMELKIGAIGGKDSMSGSFEDLDVPPTLVSFAVTTQKEDRILTNHFKNAGSSVYLIKPLYDEDGIPVTESLIEVFNRIYELNRKGAILSCNTLGYGGISEAIFKMCIGNGLGFEYSCDVDLKTAFGYVYGGFLVELKEGFADGILVGHVQEAAEISYQEHKLDLNELLSIYEGKLEPVYPSLAERTAKTAKTFSYDGVCVSKSPSTFATPKVVIPVFPGTNCEYDTVKAFRDAGALCDVFVINNLDSKSISESVSAFAEKIRSSQMIFIPGGFSGGDEPDGSGKFITSFFRNGEISEAVTDLLDKRYGLMAGICNGFQALIKLGLVPFGKIVDTDEKCPTLTFNTIGRHQSRIVNTRVSSVKSPWLSEVTVGDIVKVPISHGEGRFISSDEMIDSLARNGQIATQYVDFDGKATYDIRFNPNGSYDAIEGITSPDGRVFGKMGHSERVGSGLYKNVEGNYDIGMFKSAVKFFK